MMDWTEKYRPKEFEEMVGQYTILKALIKFRDNQNYPRLLLVGDSGTGKTTAALILACTTFETADYLEFNASDERGISIVRYDITNFAQTKSVLGLPFKTIILDECDNMTNPAQMALRRTMEKYSDNCKFILVCNELFPLIYALQSRCKVLPFDLLTIPEMMIILKRICKQEDVDYDTHQLRQIARDSFGDLRYAIESLQTVAEGRDEIDEEILEGIGNPITIKSIQEMMLLALDGNFQKSLKLFDKSCRFITAKSFFGVIEEELFANDSIFKDEDKISVALAYSKMHRSYINKNQVLGFLAALHQSSQLQPQPRSSHSSFRNKPRKRGRRS